jgi:hypothetical protein
VVPYHEDATPTDEDIFMVSEISLLVVLVTLVDRIPLPPRPKKRGRPPVYPDQLFVKALVIMIACRLPRVHSLLAVLAEPTSEMQRLRTLLTEDGRYPTRRTFERRLKAIRRPCRRRLGVWDGPWWS